MLNDLYSGYDKITTEYRAFKMETVGDAYMVASGLPIKNQRHAHLIADMSIKIRDWTKTFEVLRM